MTREEGAAIGLDVVESAATAVGQRGGALGAAGSIVAAAARVSSSLLRSGLSPEEVVEQIERVRPHQADRVDGRVDRVVGQMPGGEDVEGEN